MYDLLKIAHNLSGNIISFVKLNVWLDVFSPYFWVLFRSVEPPLTALVYLETFGEADVICCFPHQLLFVSCSSSWPSFSKTSSPPSVFPTAMSFLLKPTERSNTGTRKGWRECVFEHQKEGSGKKRTSKGGILKRQEYVERTTVCHTEVVETDARPLVCCAWYMTSTFDSNANERKIFVEQPGHEKWGTIPQIFLQQPISAIGSPAWPLNACLWNPPHSLLCSSAGEC